MPQCWITNQRNKWTNWNSSSNNSEAHCYVRGFGLEKRSKNVPKNKKAPGPKFKLSARSFNILKREAERHPGYSARILRENNMDVFGDVSVRTMRRYLRDRLRFKNVSAPKKPLLTDNHVKQRKSFVQKYEGWGVVEWKKVMFTNESLFSCSSGHSSRVWRSSWMNKFDRKLVRQTVKFPTTVMVWGSMGYDG